MRKYGTLVFAVLLCVLLTGCFVQSADELYALPLQSDEYYALQLAIGEVLADGAQYSSPVSGSNQQPVQMADLDGDGLDEAIVFMNSGDKRPLKICIFDRIGEKYENICIIEGAGSAFDRVEYAQLDGTGGLEIVVGRQLSNQMLQSIAVYSISDGQLNELMAANYSEFTVVDLDDNGGDDLFLLRFDAEARTGFAALYRYRDGTMEREPEVPMSVGIGAVRQIITGEVTEGCPAVFVSGVMDEISTVTDIFTFRNQNFTAISSLNDLHLVSVPVRGYNVYATDIDGDGNVELPDVLALPGHTQDSVEDTYYLIRWYSFDPIQGLTLVENTYHNFSGGWYLRIPDRMGSRFIVQRGGELLGSRGLSFYVNNGRDEPGGELFSLYAFTNDGRVTALQQEGCFVVGTKGETAYAARLGPGAESIGLAQEELSSMFNFIRINWESGET